MAINLGQRESPVWSIAVTNLDCGASKGTLCSSLVPSPTKSGNTSLINLRRIPISLKTLPGDYGAQPWILEGPPEAEVSLPRLMRMLTTEARVLS